MSHSPLKFAVLAVIGVIASSAIAVGAMIVFKDSWLTVAPNVTLPTLSASLSSSKDTLAETLEQVRSRALPALIQIQGKTNAVAVALTSDGYVLTTLPLAPDAKFIVQGIPVSFSKIEKDESLGIAIVKLDVEKLSVMRFKESAFMNPGTAVHVLQANQAEAATIVTTTQVTQSAVQSASAWPTRFKVNAMFAVPGSPVVIGDGMVAMVVDPQNHLALPVDAFSNVVARFLKTKAIVHPQLSVDIAPKVDGKGAALPGALIRSIKRGSAAEKAGLQPGDVIVTIEGQTIRTPSQLAELLQSFDPDAVIKIGIVRGSKNMDISVALKN